MIRITGGNERGRGVPSPQAKGVRPTASKMRQALFNILGARVQDARFLDVFAGTGLIGLEALSRGVASLTAIEQNRSLVQGIKMAARSLGYEAEIMPGDFRAAMPRLAGRKFDIIFADPPYKTDFAQMVLLLVVENHLLKDDGVLVVEHLNGCHIVGSEPLTQIDRRQYGQSAFSFFEYVNKEMSQAAP